jgi:hypothetical protein
MEVGGVSRAWVAWGVSRAWVACPAWVACLEWEEWEVFVCVFARVYMCTQNFT